MDGSSLSAAAGLAATSGRLRLRHLQCFLAVARLGRLRSAAEALAITQPAVTKTLNELEEILGVRLLLRHRRGVELTPAARAFMPHATLCLDALDQALASVQPGLAVASLRVGCLPTVAASVLAPALRQLRQAHPDTLIHVTTGSNLDLLRALRVRELELVVGRLSDPGEMAGLGFEYLYAEPLAVVVRPGHPLAYRHGLKMTDLLEWALIVPPEGTMLRHAADTLLQGPGVPQPRIALQTLSDSLACSLLLSGDEVWLTAPSAVEPYVGHGVLVRLEVPTAGSEEPVGLLTQADATPSLVQQVLVAALRAHVAARRSSEARFLRSAIDQGELP